MIRMRWTQRYTVMLTGYKHEHTMIRSYVSHVHRRTECTQNIMNRTTLWTLHPNTDRSTRADTLTMLMQRPLTSQIRMIGGWCFKYYTFTCTVLCQRALFIHLSSSLNSHEVNYFSAQRKKAGNISSLSKESPFLSIFIFLRHLNTEVLLYIVWKFHDDWTTVNAAKWLRIKSLSIKLH